MNGLTDEERRRLLDPAKKIYAHKLVQIKGYRRLAERTRDERLRRLLTRISSDEEKHAEFWSSKIQELGGGREGGIMAYLRDRKVRWMMGILGTKGLFE